MQGDRIAEEQGSILEKDLEDLPGAFEPAMAKADDLADQRFDHAEAASRIAGNQTEDRGAGDTSRTRAEKRNRACRGGRAVQGRMDINVGCGAF